MCHAALLSPHLPWKWQEEQSSCWHGQEQGQAREEAALGQLHLKQVALSKAHVLKSHKSTDGKGQETLAALYGGCLAISPALTFPEAGLNWVSLIKPKCGAGKRCRHTPAGTLWGAEGGRAGEGVWAGAETLSHTAAWLCQAWETCPAELCPGRRAGKQIVTEAFKEGWSLCASALQGEGSRKWVFSTVWGG